MSQLFARAIVQLFFVVATCLVFYGFASTSLTVFIAGTLLGLFLLVAFSRIIPNLWPSTWQVCFATLSFACAVSFWKQSHVLGLTLGGLAGVAFVLVVLGVDRKRQQGV